MAWPGTDWKSWFCHVHRTMTTNFHTGKYQETPFLYIASEYIKQWKISTAELTHPKQHSSKIHNRKIVRNVIRIDYNCNKVKQVKFCIPDCGISGSRNVLILIFSGRYQLIFPYILLPAAWESAAFLCGGKCWVLSKSFIFTSLRIENYIFFDLLLGSHWGRNLIVLSLGF